MLDATERAKPAMAYIRELEQKVRGYQNETRRLHAKWFALGLATGAVLSIILRLVF